MIIHHTSYTYIFRMSWPVDPRLSNRYNYGISGPPLIYIDLTILPENLPY